jgi:hypothetical protein
VDADALGDRPHRVAGLRALVGSWNTICARRRRPAAALPAIDLAAVERDRACRPWSSPENSRIKVVLPHPDSPTSASTAAADLGDTPSTARTTPRAAERHHAVGSSSGVPVAVIEHRLRLAREHTPPFDPVRRSPARHRS